MFMMKSERALKKVTSVCESGLVVPEESVSQTLTYHIKSTAESSSDY